VSFDPIAHATAVLTLLQAVTGLNVYDGEVPTSPPTDPDGRVHPYAVLYAGTAPTLRNSLSGTSSESPWTFQVTVAGGDRQRCGWAALKVNGALLDKRLTVAGATTSRIAGVPGPDITRDDEPRPARFYQPLLFSLTSSS